ncbi:MAG: MFS transporter [Gammaproteobacteria bacterium]|nr:MAG: MFS transporter [Gammaproteobacteria bacterium]
MDTEHIQETSQADLLSSRRFGPYFLTQFLGAFNDNVYKNALIILIAFQGVSLAGVDSNVLVNLSAGLFILPFFLFSATAGQIADKYEKSRLIRIIKMSEVMIMLLAAAGFMLNSLPLLIAVLFLMGTQSTFFGPIKYGILPQHLRPEELTGGNGLVQMGTFVAILVGTITGGLLIEVKGTGPLWVALTVIMIALTGYTASRAIPFTPPTAPRLRITANLFAETWQIMRYATDNRTVFLSILGISWFWFLGASYLAQLPLYTREFLGGGERVVTLLLASFSIGIGIGSVLCDKLSGHKVEIGLVPLGSIGLTVFGVDLFFASPGMPVSATMLGAGEFLTKVQGWRIVIDIILIGLFGGFYIVPLYALIQTRTPDDRRSRVIAAANIFNALFMVISAIVAIVLLSVIGLTIPQLFLVVALFNAAVAVYIYTLVPEFLMRFLVWLLIHTIYRVDKEGLAHIPDEGAAVLVCNHVSFVDALIIAGCCRRPVRFIIYYKFYNLPVLNFIFRTAKAIPIAGAGEDRALLKKAMDDVSIALRAGELVCIFPEGKLSADGGLNEFHPGIEHIIKRDPVPVIPMALRGLWGSVFSRVEGRGVWLALRSLRSLVELVIGKAVSPKYVDVRDLQARVAMLRGAAR